MEHFYGTDEIDPETLEDLELGDDGKVFNKRRYTYMYIEFLFFFKRLALIQMICFIQIERNLTQPLILMKTNIRMCFRDLFL
jgi:hypothetical protein